MRERANHRALVVLLAGELYRRDHGANPPSDDALIGPYLKELPDDGPGEAERQATPDAGETPSPGIDRAGVMTMASTSSVSRSFPTLRYLAAPFRWFFRSRRRAMIAAAMLLAMIVVPPLWWSLQLAGLPDIGEPFDVAAFRKFSIPDDRNAFVLYLEAADRLRPLNPPGQLQKQLDPRVLWSEADPAIRRWVEENREAMEIFRRGTERPNALDPARTSYSDPTWIPSGASRSSPWPCSRHRGWRSGATWRRAGFGIGRHAGEPPYRAAPTIVGRMIVQNRQDVLRRRIPMWASDPRTTLDQLRRALDDVVACGALAPSESYTLMAESRDLESELAGPQNPGRQALISRWTAAVRSHVYPLEPDQVGGIVDAWRSWRREPERSRRVLRLAIANRLAYDALPPEKRPKPDPAASGLLDFYALGPEAPAKARALSPAALDRWLTTTIDAQELLRNWDLQGLSRREGAGHRALVVFLAGELYRRERGTDPPSDEALVGPYLKELPDDGSGDAGLRATSNMGQTPKARGSSGQE